jgi:large subunit ribosomal protein L17
MLRNLSIALFKNKRIKTTKAKAKLLQPWAERLISLGKKNTLHSRRLAFGLLNDRTAVSELFSQLAPLFKNRTSGFTRIIHYTWRHGDGAKMVLLELTEKPKEVKPAVPKKKGAPAQKAAPAGKERPKVKPEEKTKLHKEKQRPPKEMKPKKFLGGLRKLFKKERDSL